MHAHDQMIEIQPETMDRKCCQQSNAVDTANTDHADLTCSSDISPEWLHCQWGIQLATSHSYADHHLPGITACVRLHEGIRRRIKTNGKLCIVQQNKYITYF